MLSDRHPADLRPKPGANRAAFCWLPPSTPHPPHPEERPPKPGEGGRVSKDGAARSSEKVRSYSKSSSKADIAALRLSANRRPNANLGDKCRPRTILSCPFPTCPT